VNIESFRDYCLSKKGVAETFPFGENTLVYKVMNKMFALTDIDNFQSINLKCEPEWAMELREKYPAIIPGYHMNKKHWNTILIDNSLSDVFLQKLIDHSYDCVVSKLSISAKDKLEEIK